MELVDLLHRVLDGKYLVERQLGKGGMGAVFLATHLGTTRPVALKVIVPKFAKQEEFLFRFQREAQAAGRLRHSHVVNVTDYGITQVEGSRMAYLVMEYLGGQTLANYLKQSPRPSMDLVLDVVEQISLGLDAAHAAGIVHRDLKPDNIWLESEGRGGYNVKILDFGIAKIADPPTSPVKRTEHPATFPAAENTETALMSQAGDEQATIAIPTSAAWAGSPLAIETSEGLTRVGSIIGTPAYMSPEQCRGEAANDRSDLYSLAVMTYEMLCGELPFSASTAMELASKHVSEPPLAPDSVRKSIPAAVGEVVMAGLEKNPAQRPTSASAFAARLRAASDGEISVLKQSKTVVASYQWLMLVALAAFLPLLAGVPILELGLGRWTRLQTMPDVLMLSLIGGLRLAFSLLGFHFYKAACALLLLDRGSGGPRFGSVALKLARGIPALVRTQIASLLDLRSDSFRNDLLAPVVWAAEGRVGRDAVERSRELSRVVRAPAIGLLARQYGPALVGLLGGPMLITLAGESPADVIRRGLLPDVSMNPLMIVSLMLVPMIYMPMGPAFVFLYRAACRCLGEPALPEHAPAGPKRDRRAPLLRPGAAAWWAAPAFMLAFCVVAQKRYNSGAGDRPVLDALQAGQAGVVMRLLNRGADVEASDSHDWTLLMHAVAQGQTKTVAALLDRGAKVNVRNNSGETPLHLAAAYGQTNAALLLLNHGASVDASDGDLRAALMIAAIRNDFELTRLLLRHGADPTRTDRLGKTAADYARSEGYYELAAQLTAPESRR